MAINVNSFKLLKLIQGNKHKFSQRITWLTSGYDHLRPHLRWEQLNHTKAKQPSNTRKLGRVSYEQCLNNVSLIDN